MPLVPFMAKRSLFSRCPSYGKNVLYLLDAPRIFVWQNVPYLLDAPRIFVWQNVLYFLDAPRILVWQNVLYFLDAPHLCMAKRSLLSRCPSFFHVTKVPVTVAEQNLHYRLGQ